MITSYMAIHHDETDTFQTAHEHARANLIRTVAGRNGINTRTKHDGDTSYLDAYISLPSLMDPGEHGGGEIPALGEDDEKLWGSYVEFLLDLEDSNLGYLLHEVDTEAEKSLVESLEDTGEDSCSLKYVDVGYREGSGTPG